MLETASAPSACVTIAALDSSRVDVGAWVAMLAGQSIGTIVAVSLDHPQFTIEFGVCVLTIVDTSAEWIVNTEVLCTILCMRPKTEHIPALISTLDGGWVPSFGMP